MALSLRLRAVCMVVHATGVGNGRTSTTASIVAVCSSTVGHLPNLLAGAADGDSSASMMVSLNHHGLFRGEGKCRNQIFSSVVKPLPDAENKIHWRKLGEKTAIDAELRQSK